MPALHVTQNSFQGEVLQADKPVLVDFWAEWCGPCKMIGPVIDEIADEYADQIKVTKVDVDKSQDLAAQFNVMSIPTLIVFQNGKPVDQIVGAMSKDQLLMKLEKYVG